MLTTIQIIWAINLLISFICLGVATANLRRAKKHLNEAQQILINIKQDEQNDINLLCFLLLGEYDKHGFPTTLPAPIMRYMARQTRNNHDIG